MDNKTLIELLSRNIDVSRETVGSLIDGLVECMGECGTKFESVTVPGFGSFEARKRLERVAVHPATGKRLLVPPKLSLVFRSSPNLKQRVNNGN